jgi:hypothetical protein
MAYLIAVVVVILGITTATLIRRKMDGLPLVEEDHRKGVQELEEFKLRARKIKIDLRECEVITNSYSEDRLKNNDWRLQAFDSLRGDGLSNVEQVQLNQSRVIFNTVHGTEKIAYASPAVTLDRTTLLLKLDIQNTTTLYVDPADVSKYYFDLEFLNWKS